MTQDESTHGASLADLLKSNIEAIDRELAEIEMLANQVKSEAARHEQRRAAAAEKIAGATGNPAMKDIVDTFNQLITLTKRATMMEAQADLLEAKHKALARHRAALFSFGEIAIGMGPEGLASASRGAHAAPAPAAEVDPAVACRAWSSPRRRTSAGTSPAPCTTAPRSRSRTSSCRRRSSSGSWTATPFSPAVSSSCSRRWSSRRSTPRRTSSSTCARWSSTTWASCPPSAARPGSAGARSHVPVEFESHGQDRRLSMELESTIFRMLDEGLAAYVAQGPDRATVTLEWAPAELGAVVSARRTPQYPESEALPPVPEGDVPDTIRRMIADRHEAQAAAISAAEEAAQLPLPAAVRRDLLERAAAIGAAVEILDDGEIRITVALSEADGAAGA
ncbi:MAG: hypothetical protein U0838_04685 [Chloroflexota bacterium]